MPFIVLLIELLAFLYSTNGSHHVQCCLSNGVPSHCSSALCAPHNPPGDMERYTLFEGRKSCAQYLPEISKCLADGRDSVPCCLEHAESLDDKSCIGMCNGTLDLEQIRNVALFKSCFAVNTDAIYTCTRSSHSATPSSPEKLEIVSKTESSVSLQWQPPARNSRHLHIYKVHIIESASMRNVERIHDTKESALTIDNLSTTASYSIFVVAHGRKHRGNADYHKSTPSNIVHFTTTRNIAIFEEEIRIPPTSKSATLPCHLKSFLGGQSQVEWERLTTSGWKILRGSRYTIQTYSSETLPKFLVSSLLINNVKFADFTTYRCHVKGQDEEYGQVRLTSFSYADSQPDAHPPSTIIECCSKSIHRPQCQSICTMSSVDRRVPLRPGNFLPPPKCFDELDSLFKCSLSQMNSAGCCIQEKVPYHCLGMCDNKYNMDTYKINTCLQYLGVIYQCQAKNLNLRPEAVSFVESTYDPSSDSTRFSWKPSKGSKIYHIYKRKLKGYWIPESTNSLETTIWDADEVVLLAVNDYGLSPQNRLHLVDNHWITSDY